MPNTGVILRHATPVALFVVALALVWWAWPEVPVSSVTAPPSFKAIDLASEPLRPLPEVPVLPPEKVRLGEQLFSEPRLSRDDSVSCASCHDFNRAGVDAMPVSLGVGQTAGSINAPTVFNASLNFAQFWDGRAATLEDQAAGPIQNPVEMASTWTDVLAKLKADAGYRQAFESIYPDGITAANVLDAIAVFERTLLTVDSPFDRYLKGDGGSIDDQVLDGYRRFKDYGCASCHQGANVGGNMYQRFGVMADYFSSRPVRVADLGRFNVTGQAEDRHVFKVPGLRNVAQTGPYFHDGSVATLEEAVTIMGRYQLGRDLSNDDVRVIVAFLRSLTGQWRGRPLQ